MTREVNLEHGRRWKTRDCGNNLYAFGFFKQFWRIAFKWISPYEQQLKHSPQEYSSINCFRFKPSSKRYAKLISINFSSLNLANFWNNFCLLVSVPVSRQKTLNCVFQRKRCSLPSRLRNHHQNDYTFLYEHILMNVFRPKNDDGGQTSWERFWKTRTTRLRCLQLFSFFHERFLFWNHFPT